MLVKIPKHEVKPVETIEEATPTESVYVLNHEDIQSMIVSMPTTEPVVVDTQPTEPQLLPFFEEKLTQNPDIAGWVKIEGTKLDYPMMYTPNEEDKYLHLDFDGNWSVGGLPYLEEGCSLSPESDNLIIYGHNMANGTMFHTLMSYDQKHFWEAHPNIRFSTLYEERTYEIIAAFYDRVYYKYEDCFKFYQFIDAEDEAHFQEAIDYFKKTALYDTGVTAEYGDKLITLVTCAYHVDNGRFVVVAKDVTDRNG
jgi:sortase B